VHIFKIWDETEYIVRALALSQGQGYVDIAAAPPQPETHFPFLHPLLLSLVIRLFGLNIPIMKIVLIIIYLAGLLLFVDLMRLKKEFFGAAIAALLAASYPSSLIYSKFLMSEFTYVGLSLTALWALARAESSKRGSVWMLLSASLGLSAYYTRSAGIALLVSIVISIIFLFGKQRAREGNQQLWPQIAAIFIIVAGAVAWAVYCYMKASILGLSYFLEFLGEAPNPSTLDRPIKAAAILARSESNAWTYFMGMGKFIAPWITHNSLLAAVIASLLAIMGFMRAFQRKFLAIELYGVFYILMMVGWATLYYRYLLPVYVLIYFFIISGIDFIARHASKRFGALTVAALAAVIFVLNIYSAAPLVARHRFLAGIDCGKNCRLVATSLAEWDMMTLEEWAGKSLPAQSNCLVNYCANFFLITGRPCVSAPRTSRTDPLELLVRHKVDYIFIGEAFPNSSDLFQEAISRAPYLFTKVQEIPRSGSAIYRFDWGRAPK
jgi:hypothetical protein